MVGNGNLGDGTANFDGEPATAVPLDPSGLAVGPSGTLWIDSGSDILQVAPDGMISTVAKGGPPAGVDVDVDGMPTAFFPTSMALNGQGDLIVFSFSPKLLFEVTPAGQVIQLAEDYATALSSAPDGSALVAERSTGIRG